MAHKLLALFLFGMIGLGIEVTFTSVTSLWKKDERTRHVLGYSSLWYVPLYGLVLPLGIYFLQAAVHSWPWLARGVVYGVFIQVGEFFAMGVLHLLNGESPSEQRYRAKAKRNIYGLTRWDFLPFFIVLGLLYEYLVRTWY